MIETPQGRGTTDSILATPGLDGGHVGPSDLALSRGHQPALDPRPSGRRHHHIVKTTMGPGLVSRHPLHGPAYVRRMFELGFDFASIASESRMRRWKARRSSPRPRARAGGRRPSVGGAPASSRLLSPSRAPVLVVEAVRPEGMRLSRPARTSRWSRSTPTPARLA